MDLSLELKDVFGLISLFAALFYIFQFIAFKKYETSSKKFLILYLSLLAFIMFFFECYDFGLEFTKKLIPLLIGVVLAIPPSLWIYIETVTGEKVNAIKHYLPAFIIGGIALVLSLIILNMNGSDFQQPLLSAYKILVLGSLTIGFLIQSIFYIVKSIKRLKQHEEKIANIFSYTENINLKWVKGLIYGFIVFIVAQISINVFDETSSDILFDITMLIYIIHIGFNGLKQVEIYNFETIPLEPIVFESKKTKQTIIEAVSSVKSQTIARVKIDLVELMEKEKPFLNQNLTIYQLANNLNTNSKYLSQVINTDFGGSFITYMNSYRIEEAKRLLKLKEFDNITIEAIGNKAGFKSKSSFNAAFKKFTGKTPSSYKQSASS